jgi:CRISPR/Cas system CSM-associated protein Csm4 (group 5 of RAMP superfamily)
MNKNIKKIITYTICLLLIIIVAICLFICVELKDFFKQNPIVPTINEYSSAVNVYINRYGDKIKFFPSNIPDKVDNYYCEFEDSFDGYNIYYLKFKTDEKYIKNTINENKNDIYKKIEFNQVNSYYKFIDNYFDIKDRNNAFVYILKNKNNDNNYTSGIITSKSNEIVFFYANFDIKQDKY